MSNNMGAENSLIQSLQKENEFYKQLLFNIPADIAIFDTFHKYLYVNKVALSEGDSRHWIIGKDDFDYCAQFNKPIELAINRRSYFTEALAEGAQVEFEEINKDKDGHAVFNLRKFFPVRDQYGHHDFVIGYGINITNIRKREKLQIEREKDFRQLIDAMEQLVIVCTQDGHITYANPMWKQTAGALTKNVLDIIKSSGKHFEKNCISYLANGKYAFPNKLAWLRDASQNKVRVSYHFAHFTDYNTNKPQLAMFFTNITDIIRAQQEHKKGERAARRLNQLKSNFINLVSHELRTPLSVILSSAEILEMQTAQQFQITSINSTKYLGRIVHQVEKMTKLLTDFLLVSKIESGNLSLQLNYCDVVSILRKVTKESFMPYKDGRNAIVTIKGEQKMQIADSNMLQMIFENLLSNAFKYSMGKLAPKVQIRFEKNKWTLLVVDAGIGMPEKFKKELYTAFVRGSNVGNIEGTGLGLMLVHYLVQQHLGQIHIKSSIHKGTAILIRFPYNTFE
jgi:signal transduction histidine kinase/PAS domain-containing protein